MKKIILTLAAAVATASAGAEVVAHFPMEVNNRAVTETVTGTAVSVTAKTAPEQVDGAVGGALRFDGWSTYVRTPLDLSKVTNGLTFSLWCAIETYPMMVTGWAENLYTDLAGNLDETAKTGFGFQLSSQGDWRFKCYMGGWEVAVDAPAKLPKYAWNNLVAVVDGVAKKAYLYLNGELVASGKALSTMSIGTADFIIGKQQADLFCDRFLINTFNGIVDEVTIENVAKTSEAITAQTPEHAVDLSIPESRFAGHILRPTFHGMPGACWTNEPHGLVNYNGKWHIFFQKNANGPYMARLHWGHISSDNLCKWKEEKIAIDPAEWYDIKGCWSGCTFTDDFLTNGKPNIFYTAVDNGRARICQAMPDDDGLIEWTKSASNPLLDGRPNGLTDDFRDCFVFTNNSKYYMIVGSSQNGLGVATLHRYNSGTKTWSNDGKLFFKTDNANQAGTFWEMPNVTPMGNGKWLFTCTPLGTGVGVETLYWVGTINDDGTFTPDAQYKGMPGKVELDGFSRDGYGLLSPSVACHDGKVVAMGIVPDKLPGSDNYNLGWAHNFSLPREWSLADDGTLAQKPYEGLKEMRSAVAMSKSDFDLNGTMALDPVSGRQVEVVGEFVVGDGSEFGFNLFCNGDKKAKLCYNTSDNTLTFDFVNVSRLVNDGGVYNACYSSTVPQIFSRGDVVKIHAFVDHSIVDIFLNDRWAASVRIFPTNANAKGVEAFSTGTTKVKSLNAWILDENLGGVSAPTANDALENLQVFTRGSQLVYKGCPTGSVVSLYTMSGMKVFEQPLVSVDGCIDLDCARGFYVAVLSSPIGRKSSKVVVR